MWAEMVNTMPSINDAIVELQAIRAVGKQDGVATRKAQVAYLNQFSFEDQAQILLGIAIVDSDHAKAIVQSFRDVIAEGKAKSALDVLGGR